MTYFLAAWFLNPASNYYGRRPPISPAQIQQMLRPYNLSTDVPLIQRWWTWLTDIVTHWNWGYSPVGDSVNGQIVFRIGVSGELMLAATLLAFVIGIAVGVYQASRQYKVGDRVAQFISIFGVNTPTVVVALVVVFAAVRLNRAVGTRIFFVTGAATANLTGFWNIALDKAQHLFLPSLVLIFVTFAGYAMMQRSLLLDNISADFVRTARAKGLRKSVAIRRHALRTSMIPVMVSLAFSIPGIFTGAVITETIFAWNGMGNYLYSTLVKQDINGAVAVAAFSALCTAVGAVLSDIFVVWLDPRVRVN
jgi:peptide/nickel transport system permease protein